jgi:hypothetical protein
MSLHMLTITGREHQLTGAAVQTNLIDIYEVAWSLSQVNRFVGHARRPYSVAEHSLLVADLAERDGKSAAVQLACLLHDAHEAYVGDVGSPHKNAVGLSWGAFETLQADRVRRALNVAWIFQQHARLVECFDLVALATERQQLTHYNPAHHAPWPVLDTFGAQVRPSTWANLMNGPAKNRRWNEWRDLFLERYFDLARAVAASGEQEQQEAAA